MTEPITPNLFLQGRIEPPKAPPCSPRYYVLGFWPKGWKPGWRLFESYWDFINDVEESIAKRKAEEFADTKMKDGWRFCQLILFKGLE